jgi:hypothetical protein
MTGFNPWIDVAIIAAIWVPIAGALLFCEWRKSKTQKALRGATRV